MHLHQSSKLSSSSSSSSSIITTITTVLRSSSSSLRSPMSENNSSLGVPINEHRWVIHVRRTLEEELEEDGEFPVSIFNVPKLLMASDPESYVPQLVAIGPYHYWRPELYEMERYKLSAARRFQRQLQNQKLENLVEQLTTLEDSIRGSYHKYLDFDGETMVWMMAVDASFLLEFLRVYAILEGGKVPGISSRMSHLVDYAGQKSAHNAILRDIVMLENQIPLFVLRKVLEFKFSSLEAADDVLLLKILGLFRELSPFKMMAEAEDPNASISECAHLLEFCYNMLVPKSDAQQPDLIVNIEVDDNKDDEEGNLGDKLNIDPSYLKKFLIESWKLLSKLNKGPVILIKKVLLSPPMKVLVKLPWKTISNLPGVKLIKKPVESFFNSTSFDQEKKTGKKEGSSSKTVIGRPPLIEEITIPSVTELMNSGVRFVPSTEGSISSINFDTKTRTFYLPVTALDMNTEVFLRNLVAYEASVASGPLILTRYTELMNGIIDSEEDAKALRERGVILNHLKSDAEVADLWNGMSKSIKLTKVPLLDKVVEDVNRYYNGRMNVKACRFMKRYVIRSWQFLTFLSAILLLLLTALQAFCSVYTCRRFWSVDSEGY